MAEQSGQGALKNLRELPSNVRRSVGALAVPVTRRERAQAVAGNFFLHVFPVKTHVNSLRPAYTLGLGMITLFLFLILTATGIVLMVYYAPSTEFAYEDMKTIIYVVPFGRLLRNMHRWAAHGMVLAVLLHMARVFYTESYAKGRAFNWVVGMILFVLTLVLSYTGYLLPWDQLAYWAATIGANIAGSAREVTDGLGVTAWFDPGGMIRELVVGGSSIHQGALTRFYLLHIMVVPIVTAILIGLHLWRVRKDGGLTRPERPAEPQAGPEPAKTYGLMAYVRDRGRHREASPDDTVLTWPTTAYANLFLFMFTMLVLLALSHWFDGPLKTPANPAVPENPAKAPWYFLGLQELVSFSAFMGGVGIPTIVLAGLLLVPYVDREERSVGVWFSGRDGGRVALTSAAFGLVAVIGVEAFAIGVGWLRDFFPRIPQIVITVFNPGTVITGLFMLWSVAVVRWTRSTRLGAISLFSCFLVAFVVLSVIGVHFRGPNWVFYWSPGQWPLH